MMSFTEWSESSRRVPDLSLEGIEGCEFSYGPGVVYPGDLYIEGPDAEGLYDLTIANEQWYGAGVQLEEVLYSWAESEGYFEVDADLMGHDGMQP